jgi:hypothetical protein
MAVTTRNKIRRALLNFFSLKKILSLLGTGKKKNQGNKRLQGQLRRKLKDCAGAQLRQKHQTAATERGVDCGLD